MNNVKLTNTTDTSDIHSHKLSWAVTFSRHMKVDEISTSETSVYPYETTRRHLLDDSIRGHRRDNLQTQLHVVSNEHKHLNTKSPSNLTLYDICTANFKHLHAVIAVTATTTSDGEWSDSISISFTLQYRLYWRLGELQKLSEHTSYPYQKPVLRGFPHFTSCTSHDRHNENLPALLILSIPFLSQLAWGHIIFQHAISCLNTQQQKRHQLVLTWKHIFQFRAITNPTISLLNDALKHISVLPSN